MIRLSIIVPFYNVEPFIEQCIRSIYDQDIPQEEYEVICVDDCSPDNSRAIVEKLQEEHSNLLLICHDRNKKLGGARNTGLRAAKGQYVWFVDSDDLVSPNVFGRMLEIVEQNNLDFLHFDFRSIKEGLIVDSQSHAEKSVCKGIDLFFDASYVWWKDHIVAWQKIFSSKFLYENRLFFAEDVMYEDNDFSLKAYAYSQKVMHAPIFGYVYRQNPQSVTHVAPTSNHITYHMDLCSRLLRLKEEFCTTEIDARFAEVIEGFLRDEIHTIWTQYHEMPDGEKEKSKKVISSGINRTMRNYMSLKKYLLIKLRLI